MFLCKYLKIFVKQIVKVFVKYLNYNYVRPFARVCEMLGLQLCETRGRSDICEFCLKIFENISETNCENICEIFM